MSDSARGHRALAKHAHSGSTRDSPGIPLPATGLAVYSNRHQTFRVGVSNRRAETVRVCRGTRLTRLISPSARTEVLNTGLVRRKGACGGPDMADGPSGAIRPGVSCWKR